MKHNDELFEMYDRYLKGDKCQAGKLYTAFSKLINKEARPYYRNHSSDSVDDAKLEAIAKIFMSNVLETHNRNVPVLSYFHTVIGNFFRDWHRKEKAGKRSFIKNFTSLNKEESAFEDTFAEVPPGEPAKVEKHIDDHVDSIRDFVKGLSADRQKVFRLAFEKKMKSKDIAAALGLSVSNVNVLRFRLKTELKARFGSSFNGL